MSNQKSQPKHGKNNVKVVPNAKEASKDNLKVVANNTNETKTETPKAEFEFLTLGFEATADLEFMQSDFATQFKKQSDQAVAELKKIETERQLALREFEQRELPFKHFLECIEIATQSTMKGYVMSILARQGINLETLAQSPQILEGKDKIAYKLK